MGLRKYITDVYYVKLHSLIITANPPYKAPPKIAALYRGAPQIDGGVNIVAFKMPQS